VQLYLRVLRDDGLVNSHTNHASIKRAEAWAAVSPEMGPVESWDFKKITAFSSRLNRQVRKMSAAKIDSCPMLRGALRLCDEGVSMLPFRRDGSVTVVRADA
jgi:hypothetical protein